MSGEPRRARVGRRRIVYVPGYDPRPPSTYACLFEAELAKFAKLQNITCSVRARRCRLVEGTNGVVLSVTAQWSDGPVESEMHILDWHDIALADFALGHMRRLGDSLVVLWRSLVSGVLAHVARLNWKFALFSLYPWIMLVAYATAACTGAAIAFALARTLFLPWPLALVPAVIFGAAALRLTTWLDRKLFVWYLLNDWIFTYRYRTGTARDADRRFDRFAVAIVELARRDDCDEILVIGHSSGSFVAIDVVDRALRMAPDLGGAGPRLSLLTLGANVPIVVGGPGNPGGREALTRLVLCPRLRWVEYTAHNDVMNFPWLDYVAAFELDLGGRPALNPERRAAAFVEITNPERYRRMALAFYRLHFRFLMANDMKGAYDFYRFICGPMPLS
jgi:hypothetical protein